MSRKHYTDDELQRYFEDPHARRPGVTDSEVRRRVRLTLTGISLVVAGVFLALILTLGVLAFTLPSTELIENPEHLESTIVYTADGVEMARYYLGQNRTWVTNAQISHHMREALIATEDRRFYDHWGVDMRSFAAVAAGALRGERMRGGSTITMQLSRNLYEQIGFERSPIRKVREIMTSIQIERRYTKEEILEMYLNTVPWGNNAYGIEAASMTYFSKPAIELEVEEAAVLVGMLKGTTRYSPVRNTERSTARRNVVLASMEREGFISRQKLADLREQPIKLQFRPYSHTDNLAPHLAEILREELRTWGRQNGYNIYTDGLVVHTSIDSRLQEMAKQAVVTQGAKLQAVVDVDWAGRGFYSSNEEDYVRRLAQGNITPWAHFWNTQTRLTESFIRETERFRQLRRDGVDPGDALQSLRGDEAFMDSLRTAKTRLEVGFVAVDPKDGFVRAWVGGRDYTQDQFDHVRTMRRQSGSTFKPFVFVAAIDNGYSPYYQLLDSTFVWTQQGAPAWSPRNAGGAMSGQYQTLRTTLARSMNIPTARLTQEIGPLEVKRYAERLGIESPLQAVPSIGLGVADVTLLEMVAAYATLANGGTYHRPHVITRIEDRQGNLLAEFRPQGREALSPHTAYTVVDMLREAIDNGTGGRIRWKFNVRNHDVAGKTGTTQEGADGWFVAMHPDLVVGSWVGFNDRRIQIRHSSWATGGRTGLHVVGDFLRRVTTTDNPAVRLQEGRRFQPPPGYVVPTGPPPRDRMEHRPAADLLEAWDEHERRREGDSPQRREDDRRGRVGW